MKFSFDFDSTLDRHDVQHFVKQLISNGYEVWIVTSREDTESALKKGHWWVEKNNQALYNVANDIGIPFNQIKFTTHIDKIIFLKDKNFIFHVDDDEDELIAISESGDPCIPINVNHFEWKEKCLEIISNTLSNI